MAYDPEARRQSNSALIIALVSALVLGGGALAYFATRSQPEPAATTVINTPDRETVVVNNTVSVPVPVVAPTSAPNVVVREVPNTVVVQPAPATNTVTRIERNSTTVRDRVVAPRPSGGASSGTSTAPGASSNTNVTVNVPPAGGASGSTTTNSGTSGASDSAGSAATDTAPAGGAAGNAAPAGSGGY